MLYRAFFVDCHDNVSSVDYRATERSKVVTLGRQAVADRLQYMTEQHLQKGICMRRRRGQYVLQMIQNIESGDVVWSKPDGATKH